MTPQQIEALKLALEALEADELDMVDDGSGNMVFRKEQAITAIEEALTEHAMREVQRLGQEIEQKIGCVNHDCDQCKAQPEQEPCGWQFFQGGKWYNGMETNNHRANTEAAGIPVRDVYPSPQRTEQEPLAWRNAAIRVGEDLSSVGPDGYYDMTAQQWLDWAMSQEPHGKNSLAQPEQEPVAVYGYCPQCGAKGVMRERRPNGNDKCANGHTYPSSVFQYLSTQRSNHD